MKVKKLLGMLIGVGLCATALSSGKHLQFASTQISAPRIVRANSRDTIHVNTSGLWPGASYHIQCVLSAPTGSGGVYAAFLTKNIAGVQLTFAGKKITSNENLIVKEIPAPIDAAHVKVTATQDQSIVIENRDGKDGLKVGACNAWPELLKVR